MIALKGRIIDAISDKAIENGVVLMENDKIVRVSENNEIPENTEVYEVKDGTIMPGFIDAHAHLNGEEDAGSFANGKMFGDKLMGSAYQAGVILDSGFTSIRDMSEAGLYVSRAQERGIIRAPRIFPGGRLLGITSGHVDDDPTLSKDEYNRLYHDYRLVDGVDDCIQGVREQFRLGARFIKICATGGVSSPTDRIDDVQFAAEELEAIVAEAKRHHSYVAAHCTGNEGAYACLKAGVDCIEHGVFLTQREIDLMKEKDATLVTTLYIALNVANFPGLPDYLIEKAQNCASANRHTIEMALKANLRIAFGSDFSNSKNTPYKKLGLEFKAMVEAGLSNIEAIRAGTINAAYLLKMDDQIGSLEEGKMADIVIVKGNPLKDIDCLTDADNIEYVFQSGKLVKGKQVN